MQPVDYIIQAKWLITCETPNKILQNHALIIEKDKIKAILPIDIAASQYQAKKTIHYSDHAVIPGFINAHTHISMNYFRGLADDLALMNWLNNYIWPAEKQWVSHEFVRDASLFAMAEMIRGGTTCFNDMYFFPDATAEAAEISGMRAHIGMTVIEFPTRWANTTDEYFARGMEFFEKFKNHSLVTATLAPHAPYTVSDQSMLRIKQIAEQHHLKINLHLHETADEVNQSLKQYNKRPIKRLHDLGLITPDLIAVHMTQIDDEDMKILQQGKPSVVHCPESNMKLASGICPVEKLQRAGLNVALGTDGAASNNDLDMIGEMRSCALLAKLATLNPENMTAENTLQLATAHGAKALGIDRITGTLEAGKSADFAVVDLSEMETLPVYHPVSQIVYAAGRHQVKDVWVRGKQLMKDRELLTLDEKELRVKARDWAAKIKVPSTPA